jgi:hypothetical protein
LEVHVTQDVGATVVLVDVFDGQHQTDPYVRVPVVALAGEGKVDNIFCTFGCSGKPGLAPAGEALFFASPKKTTEKKGEPNASSLRCAVGKLCCSGSAGCAETRPACSNICAPFSATPCATRLLITARGAAQLTRLCRALLRKLPALQFLVRNVAHSATSGIRFSPSVCA